MLMDDLIRQDTVVSMGGCLIVGGLEEALLCDRKAGSMRWVLGTCWGSAATPNLASATPPLVATSGPSTSSGPWLACFKLGIHCILGTASVAARGVGSICIDAGGAQKSSQKVPSMQKGPRPG